MKISYGIITQGNSLDFVNKILDSIYAQNGMKEEDFEIVIVGGPYAYSNRNNIKHVPFDEQGKSLIGLKKNILLENCSNEIVTIGHDYVAYNNNFYIGMKAFGSDWDMAMCKIRNLDGKRYRDWCVFLPEIGVHPDEYAIQWLDYNDHTQTKKQYISGAFYICKRSYILKFRFDETKEWGFSEDILLSYHMRYNNWNLKMNKNSEVYFLKEKPTWPLKNPSFAWKPEYEIV